MTEADLQARARRKLAGIRRRRRDPRYVRVMGRFVGAGLLTTNERVPPNKEALDVHEVLWAGKVEPRLLELLPALLVKRPAMFVDATDLPEDLEEVVRRLRRNLVPDDFRGIAGVTLHGWLPRVGRKNRVPSRLKSFRFKAEDLRLLRHLSKELELTETDVIRRGLRKLFAEHESA